MIQFLRRGDRKSITSQNKEDILKSINQILKNSKILNQECQQDLHSLCQINNRMTERVLFLLIILDMEEAKSDLKFEISPDPLNYWMQFAYLVIKNSKIPLQDIDTEIVKSNEQIQTFFTIGTQSYSFIARYWDNNGIKPSNYLQALDNQLII
jgi:hypothetical protein